MTELQDSVLRAALPLVVFEGWTDRMLAHAARDAGLPEIDARRAFPGGVREAIAYWLEAADRQMVETLSRDYNLLSMKIRERIATAVMVRLRQQTPYREAVRRATAYLCLPWNTRLSLGSLYRTVDAMWRVAGDRATDYNFYTKRALLAQVYLSTLAVWLNDDSDDLETTEAFLHRRIEDVMQIERVKSSFIKTFSHFPPRAA